MARKPGSTPQAMKNRAAKTAAAIAPASALAQAAPKKKTSPGQFFREVRAEGRKITWTTRKETWITSVMVGIMVVLAAIFFSLVDGALTLAMAFLLKLANAG
ncbi:MAG: preprotein translocase subunit SecE [Phenylobacterium sp.]|uniref:Protein translocase subunit SecE n=1 Tax=Phenylobacterium ferrooxidans TaxID=2982689 RepID=A0ABW6CSD2_9CAUL|nr:preprotein translocase subunit SecE [Phenylobacterium sp.]MDO8322655.1 preprotein translocase subunit SecE [Phenylobacterium sp.]MDO8910900.1 preprotein translocase subunit SecE [Phenylobacterium sp.]MDO9246809.1 preprotein translocase subunit SecE [Phenylobacterium sp.]MDP2008692.1 preprotein translocase subunit SecE [Phenylobacterium sp.]MDP3099139.1 preprotein translocase subunit SecE [Phenylobacterium sp.]